MAFPGWGPFEGDDSVDLGDTERDRIASAAVPVPEDVSKGVVRLADERRFDVPVVVVCPEYSPDEAKAWIDAGDVPELSRAEDVALADINSGHWSMVTPARRTGSDSRLRGQGRLMNPVTYDIRELDASTWDAFAELVERNNGIFGGCWCIGYHPECGQKGISHRAVKEDRVRTGRAHAALVLDEQGVAQGWCQYGSPEELPNIKHKRKYDQDAPPIPDWRITCFYVDRKHRGQGIARAALEGALDQIARLGGGLVEAIPEVTADREAQGRFLFSATVELFDQYGFTRGRQVGKHAWIVSKTVDPA